MSLKHYRLTALFISTMETQTIDKWVDQWIAQLVKTKGQLVRKAPLVVQQLAYPIKRNTEASLQTYFFQALPSLVKQLERPWKEEERILRYQIFALNKNALAYYEAKQKTGEPNLQVTSQ